MTFKRLNCITGWFAGLIATIVYFLTLEPTVSWWDCGEYISTAYKLQVGHPPGAPLFQMLGRFFSLFAFGDVTKVAMMINAMSAICSGLTIVFLFWSITMMAQKVWMKEGEDAPWTNKIGVLLAGFVGAVAYTFTESFWFNAVEGEVYAMSSFFTAVTFWAILKWEQVADDPRSNRWIIFIAFLIGLSIGVHLLNLLCVPAFVYVVYFKKWKKTSVGGFLLAGAISVALLWFLNMFLVPQVVNLAGKFELFFVNTLHAPFNLGTIVYFALIIGLIAWGLWYSSKKKHLIANTAILSLMFILIGYSSFFMLAIRANTNTPINENEPKDALSMLSYLNREQYGSWPLLYGQYYNAPISRYKDGNPIYVKDKAEGRYVITNDGKQRAYEYSDSLKTVFPRMWSSSENHRKIYEKYRKDESGNIIGNKVTVKNRSNQLISVNKPTFGQNLRFFFDYQCNWMYWRYFMWNFVGRQNDIESQGELSHGNWISGISFIDNARLGDQSDMPASMHNSGRTTYYFLPLILGLIGLIWLIVKDPKQSWIIFLLFFMTGLAIIVYLNQTPQQPRERDYSYAGSFYAFAIWIGFGVIAIIDCVNKLMKKETLATVVSVGCVCFLAVPCVLAVNGWEEHNRSGKTSARDWAKNYLVQLPKNSVIFTRGDNDTFPLWYVQEVEGFRTDVRVCNYMLSSGHWYVHQMGRKVYDSERLPLMLPPEAYENGINEAVQIYEDPALNKTYTELKDVIFKYHNTPNDNLRIINKEILDKEYRLITLEESKKLPQDLIRYNIDTLKVFPYTKVKLTVDKEACIRNGIVPKSMQDRIVDEITWTIQGDGIGKNDLMLLDFMASNNWERPIYFSSFGDIEVLYDLSQYFYFEGLNYRFIPVKPDGEYGRSLGGVNLEDSYDLLVTKANEGIVKWGNLNQEGVVPDRESIRNLAHVERAYTILARSLINHQKFDSAVIVLDKYQEFFPIEKFHSDASSNLFPYLYYCCGTRSTIENPKDSIIDKAAMDKGDAYLMQLIDDYCDIVDFYAKMDPKFWMLYKNEITDDGLSPLFELRSITSEFNNTKMYQEINTRLNRIPSGIYEVRKKVNEERAEEKRKKRK